MSAVDNSGDSSMTAICNECQMIGPWDQAMVHHEQTGHEIETLDHATAEAIEAEYRRRQAERVASLIAYADFMGRSNNTA